MKYIHNYLDLSTGHLTVTDKLKLSLAAEADNLDDYPLNVIVRSHPYGWWVHVDYELDIHELTHSRMAPSFLGIYLYAQQMKCNWINFDSDGERHPGFVWHEYD